jgi:hypothetical protein
VNFSCKLCNWTKNWTELRVCACLQLFSFWSRSFKAEGGSYSKVYSVTDHCHSFNSKLLFSEFNIFVNILLVLEKHHEFSNVAVETDAPGLAFTQTLGTDKKNLRRSIGVQEQSSGSLTRKLQHPKLQCPLEYAATAGLVPSPPKFLQIIA